MKEKDFKKNNPELIVDWNGNAVQAWVLGGRTIGVPSGSTFNCESTLLRLCNTGSSVARIRLYDARHDEYIKYATDEGTPILPNTCVMVGVHSLGQKYIVEGGSLDVTFLLDRRVRQGNAYIPMPFSSVVTKDDKEIAGPLSTFNYDPLTNIIEYGGIINQVKGKNYVGIKITPSTPISQYDSLIIVIIDQFGTSYHGKEMFDDQGNLEYIFEVQGVPSREFGLQIHWDPQNAEYFKVLIDPETVLI